MSKKKEAEIREERDWNKVDEVVFRSENFFERNAKTLFIIVAVVVVAVCGWLAYNHFYIAPKNVEAQEAMFKGERYFGEGRDSLALFGDGNAYPGFVKIAEDYSSTKAGKLAGAYAGLCYTQLNKYEEALPYLQKYSGDDKIFKHLVVGAIGDCLVNTGKEADAISNFIKAAEGLDNSVQSPIYYKKAALIYRAQGNNDRVIELFTLVKDKYSNSPVALEADKYIDEANFLKAGK